MNKLLLSFSLALLPIVSFTQDLIGTFEMPYFSETPTHNIRATEKGDFYVECASLDKLIKNGGITIDAKKLADFKAALTAARDRFVEWSGVAIQNGVTELTKEMEISSPSIQGYWLQGEWHFDFSQALTYRFTILKDGKHVLVVTTGKLQASDNQFMDHDGMALAFTSAAEIDALIAGLDPAKVTAHFEEKKKKADLFK